MRREIIGTASRQRGSEETRRYHFGRLFGYASTLTIIGLLAACTTQETGRRAPVVDAANFGTKGDLEGRWTGRAFCKKDTWPVALDVRRAAAGYRGTYTIRNTPVDYELKPNERNAYLYDMGYTGPEKSQRRYRTLTSIHDVIDVDQRSTFMKVGMLSPCKYSLLVRFDPIASLAGTYATSSDFSAMCRQVADGWLSIERRERQVARDLKVRFSVALARYDPDAAATAALLAADDFETVFGQPLDRLSPKDAEDLFAQIGQCAFLADGSEYQSYTRSLFDARRLNHDRNYIRYGRYNPDKPVALKTSVERMVSKAADIREAEGELQVSLAGWRQATSASELEQFLQSKLSTLRNVRPSLLADSS